MSNSPTNAKDIFLDAVEHHAPDQWPQFLDHACGDDEALRRRVAILLAAHDRSNRLLDASGPVATIEVRPAKDLVGASIGPYKLLDVIGEGGFGVVYLAQQSVPVQRQVALKVIKPGMDSRHVVARFEAERQAVAMMDHPNIAKILDAGTINVDRSLRERAVGSPSEPPTTTHAGRPYFAMELVKGVPITDYCDRCHLTNSERLKLFVDVCHAVQHAHQKGVIHRDLKPSNVLVAMQDDEPAPKVIDFGVAKAVGQKLTAHTLQTRFTQMIGTPAYMSPEQAELSPVDVDTRSDVYSLGVLLYELLTGATPVSRERIVKASFDALRRIIREEDPPRPSTRVSTLAAGDAVTIAERRRIDARHLAQQLRGELDWIVLRALEKDRRRRYESPGAFAADVQRYLNNEAVEACPPSRAYRLRKSISRHRGLAAAIGAIIASLSVGLVMATFAFFVAEQRRADTQRESSRANRIALVLNEMLQSADPNMGKGEDYTVREMLDEFAPTLDGRFEDDPVVEGRLRHIIGRSYYHLGLPEECEPHLRRALELCHLDPEGQLDEPLIRTELAQTLLHAPRHLGEAETLIRKAIRTYRERGEASPDFANALWVLGWISYKKTEGLRLAGQDNEGEMANREALEIIGDRKDKRSLTIKAKLYTGLTWELLRGGPDALSDANKYAEKARKLLSEHAPNEHFYGMAVRVGSMCLILLGNPGEAKEMLEVAMERERARLGVEDAETLFLWMTAMFHEGNYSKALEQARSIDSNDLAKVPASYVASRIILGWFLLELGDLERAENRLREAWESGAEHLGPEHYLTIDARFWLAHVLLEQDNAEKRVRAQAIFAELLPLMRDRAQSGREPDSHGFAMTVGHLPSPPLADVEMATAMNRRVLDQPLLEWRRIRNLHAGALVKNRDGDTKGAIALLEEIAESKESPTWQTPPTVRPFQLLKNSEDVLARMLVDSGNVLEAEQVYRRAIDRRKTATPPDPYQVLLAEVRLAEFLSDRGDQVEARKLLAAANDVLADAPACFDWLGSRVSNDLLKLGEIQSQPD